MFDIIEISPAAKRIMQSNADLIRRARTGDCAFPNADQGGIDPGVQQIFDKMKDMNNRLTKLETAQTKGAANVGSDDGNGRAGYIDPNSPIKRNEADPNQSEALTSGMNREARPNQSNYVPRVQRPDGPLAADPQPAPGERDDPDDYSQPREPLRAAYTYPDGTPAPAPSWTGDARLQLMILPRTYVLSNTKEVQALRAKSLDEAKGREAEYARNRAMIKQATAPYSRKDH